MGRGIVLARRTQEPISAYGVTGVAILVSVALWVVLSEPLQLPDSSRAGIVASAWETALSDSSAVVSTRASGQPSIIEERR